MKTSPGGVVSSVTYYLRQAAAFAIAPHLVLFSLRPLPPLLRPVPQRFGDGRVGSSPPQVFHGLPLLGPLLTGLLLSLVVRARARCLGNAPACGDEQCTVRNGRGVVQQRCFFSWRVGRFFRGVWVGFFRGVWVGFFTSRLTRPAGSKGIRFGSVGNVQPPNKQG